MKKVLVIYHINCMDGLASAAIARQFFLLMDGRWIDEVGDHYLNWDGKGPEVAFFAANYNEPPPDHAKDFDTIFLVDFSYAPEHIVALRKCSTVVILDHHDTPVRSLRSFDWPAHRTEVKHDLIDRMDTTRAGCVNAWRFFWAWRNNPTMSGFRSACNPLNEWDRMPWWVEYIEDRDVWAWKLEGSHEVNEFLRMATTDATHEDFWDICESVNRETALVVGKMLSAQKKKYIGEMVKGVTHLDPFFGFTNVPCVNMTFHAVSETLNELALASECKFAIGWYVVGDPKSDRTQDSAHPLRDVLALSSWRGGIKFSLRAVDGGPNVAKIAEEFGGGGHPKAAGFYIKGTDIGSILDCIRDGGDRSWQEDD